MIEFLLLGMCVAVGTISGPFPWLRSATFEPFLFFSSAAIAAALALRIS